MTYTEERHMLAAAPRVCFGQTFNLFMIRVWHWMAMNKFQVIFLDCGKREMQAGGQTSRLWCPGFNWAKVIYVDTLCGLLVRTPGYTFGDPWVDSRRYQIFWEVVGLQRGPLRTPGYTSGAPEVDSLRYQIFWEVVGLQRGPLSLVSTIEELLEIKSSCSGLENREYGRGNPLRCPRDTLNPQKLTLTADKRRSLGRYNSLAV
jgi:hypothetical protein